MKEKRIVAFGTMDKPAHGIYHVLPGRKLPSIPSIVRKKDDISRLIAPALYMIYTEAR